jgi:hypothetical protein
LPTESVEEWIRGNSTRTEFDVVEEEIVTQYIFMGRRVHNRGAGLELDYVCRLR